MKASNWGVADTEIKTHANRLEGEPYFKRAFAHASIGLALVDLDGRFTYTNPAYATLTGYSSRELKAMKIGTLMHPEDAAVNAKFRAKMLAGKIPGYNLEKRYIRKDGSIVWVNSSISLAVDSSGKPIGIVGITEDVDERRKAEAALRESEARFRFIAESMPPKVFTADLAGMLTYLSPQWNVYTGLDFKDMSISEWGQIVHPDDRVSNMKAWEQAVRTGEPFYFEHRLRRADGVYRWHVCRASALKNEEGDVIEWIGSDTDIEELRHGKDMQARLRELAKQREQLISTNRLKDEFLMLASHQLRTPASGVKIYIGMLLEGFSDDITADQRELLGRAYENNNRQLKIIDDLLRVARVDAGQVSLAKANHDLVKLIHGIVLERQNFFHRRKQNLVFAPSYKTLEALIDIDLMRIVLENLLDNASKYSGEKKVTSVSLIKDGETLTIEVKDNGVGIRSIDQKRLFQKFSRINNSLNEEYTGTGLGLYWSKKIVELHGGTIEVTSKFHKGSTFRVRLPMR